MDIDEKLKSSDFLSNDYKLVWADDFKEKELDKTKWSLVEHMHSQEDLEIRFDDSAVTVENSMAILHTDRIDENRYFTSATLTTSETMIFKYGYLEMRAKVPYGKPSFPAFWMKSAKIDNPDAMGEIDIFEHWCGKGKGFIESALHLWYHDNGLYELSTAVGNYDFKDELLAEDWHNYGLLWTPDKLDFMVDGHIFATFDLKIQQELLKSKGTDILGRVMTDMKSFDDYYYVIINNYLYTPKGMNYKNVTANSNDVFPIDYKVDYVRLFQNEKGVLKLLK